MMRRNYYEGCLGAMCGAGFKRGHGVVIIQMVSVRLQSCSCYVNGQYEVNSELWRSRATCRIDCDLGCGMACTQHGWWAPRAGVQLRRSMQGLAYACTAGALHAHETRPPGEDHQGEMGVSEEGVRLGARAAALSGLLSRSPGRQVRWSMPVCK